MPSGPAQRAKPFVTMHQAGGQYLRNCVRSRLHALEGQIVKRTSPMLSFNSLTLLFNSMNAFDHMRALKTREGIDIPRISLVFQPKLLVSYVNAFLAGRFHICVTTSVMC